MDGPFTEMMTTMTTTTRTMTAAVEATTEVTGNSKKTAPLWEALSAAAASASEAQCP